MRRNLFSSLHTAAMKLLRHVKSLCAENRKGELENLRKELQEKILSYPVLNNRDLYGKLEKGILKRNALASSYLPSSTKEDREFDYIILRYVLCS